LPLLVLSEPLSAVLSLTVAVVAAGVFVYAVGYMRVERDQVRFFAELSFFVAAMQMLVLAGDWLLFLAAWELIGLASYLLIGFWFEQPDVPRAASRAFLTTRAADLGLYLGVFVLVTATGTTRIGETLHVGGPQALAASLLLLVAAMGKSAQVPFQGWLQDAMLGPTPVSALLHSATLVAAGAILLVRVSPMLPEPALLAIGMIGGLTILVTGFMATLQRDLKRLLASSTSSQVGFMLVAIGAGSPMAALAHLVAHAAMKSSLFLGAGSFQHAYETTSLDGLTGAGRRLKPTFALFALAAFALVGVPPLAGFWSKEAIEAATLSSPLAAVLAPMGIAGTLLTGIYMARALRLLWFGEPRPAVVTASGWMLGGLLILATLSLVLGPALRPMVNFLGGELPESSAGLVLGLTATVAGLLIGWFTPAIHLPGSLRASAEVGFRVGAGWLDFAVRPALVVAGRGNRLEAVLNAAVLDVGTAALGMAWATRQLDERGIDALISELVTSVRALGERARRLQSGLVFRELALAGAGIAAAATVLLIWR
jgi:NADH-quinone oxidoreductase subunit L